MQHEFQAFSSTLLTQSADIAEPQSGPQVLDEEMLALVSGGIDVGDGPHDNW